MDIKFGGRIKEIKEIERNGEPIGILAGYIATWDIDRGHFGVRDQFVRGAFIESLRQHQVSDRPVRLKDQHNEVVGGFPISSVHEDEVGLFGIGEVNLTMERGREIMSLARQGVLSDFSVGFSVIEFTEDEGLRKITKAILWEGSVVDEPMNPKAKITEIKGFHNLPIVSDRDYKWNPEEALARINNHVDGNKAFINGTLIADIVDGELRVVPKALFKAAESGKNIRDIEKYYAKMNLESPFDEDKREYFTESDIKCMTTRKVEKALIKTGCFSASAAKIIAGIDKTLPIEDNTQIVLNELKELLNSN